jgi:hypothetical protein
MILKCDYGKKEKTILSFLKKPIPITEHEWSESITQFVSVGDFDLQS